MKHLNYWRLLPKTLVFLGLSLALQAQKVNPAKDWKFGVALWTFHTYHMMDAIAYVDSAGLSYLEPNTFQNTGPRFGNKSVAKLSDEEYAQLRKHVADKNMQVHSVYLSGGNTLDLWQQQFEIAKKMGARFVTAEPPLHLLDGIHDLAGKYQMKVAIHEHWKGVSKYWHPDSVLAAIQGRPNFGVCADLGHWPKSGINPLDAVKRLKGHILAVHLKDIAEYNNPKLRDVPVGEGVVDFPGIFKELKAQGFKGYIYIERDAEDKPSNLPSVKKTVRYYQQKLKELK